MWPENSVGCALKNPEPVLRVNSKKERLRCASVLCTTFELSACCESPAGGQGGRGIFEKKR